MEYIVFFAVIGGLLLVLFAKGTWDNHKQQKWLIKHLYDDYGKQPEREYKVERFLRIGSYFDKHPAEGQIDDVTWNDLNMDEVFKRMNHTLSSTGEEYLYYTLRTPRQAKEELEHQEELASFFMEHPDERVKVQLLMKKLGSTGNYSLYDYLDYLGVLGERSNRIIILRNLLLVALIGLCFVNFSVGLAGIMVLLVYNITTYFKDKKEIEPYIISFSYVMRLLDICDRLVKIPVPVCSKEWEQIRDYKKKLGRMKMGSGWVLSGSAKIGSGNPLEILMDYLNMAFHIDIMMFNKMLGELNHHLEDVDALVGIVGAVETSICIGAYRASMKNGWCIPTLYQTDGAMQLTLKEAYHPLIDTPVKNSIVTERGVLLTGSNASGKSTFLKTVALNAILAQTIYTCPADSYEAPFFRIYSSMALKDDIGSGESYYIVEIKSLKRILENVSEKPVLCFVDEVLRGTNTVERIAASTQILSSLGQGMVMCFAATHDIELTELLKEEYENYHFEEEIRDGDIYFNYQLLKGKATTRNAIRLLEIMGYKEAIIKQATQMAEHFIRTGVWEKKES
ncbi:MAG: hypothetical protein IJZ34_13870 [Lachnospiraceae bacterium]|nr:hypothetical protein [Lachnospiraceae bacterium]